MNLPVDPDFVSRPPLVSIAVMQSTILMLRRSFPQGLPTPEERLQRKMDVPFVF